MTMIFIGFIFVDFLGYLGYTEKKRQILKPNQFTELCPELVFDCNDLPLLLVYKLNNPILYTFQASHLQQAYP